MEIKIYDLPINILQYHIFCRLYLIDIAKFRIVSKSCYKVIHNTQKVFICDLSAQLECLRRESLDETTLWDLLDQIDIALGCNPIVRRFAYTKIDNLTPHGVGPLYPLSEDAHIEKEICLPCTTAYNMIYYIAKFNEVHPLFFINIREKMLFLMYLHKKISKLHWKNDYVPFFTIYGSEDITRIKGIVAENFIDISQQDIAYDYIKKYKRETLNLTLIFRKGFMMINSISPITICEFPSFTCNPNMKDNIPCNWKHCASLFHTKCKEAKKAYDIQLETTQITKIAKFYLNMIII